MRKTLAEFVKNSSLGLISLIFTGLIVFGGIYLYMTIQLPDVSKLKEKVAENPLRIYSSDNKFINEFGEKKRLPITLKQVPPQLIHAILDTEDQRFYEHKGVDFVGLCRATMAFIISGKKAQGASTITMQVARECFLNRQKTFGRKFNEILLAFKIDNTFTKDEILELYLNRIFFGSRAYGVAAAARVYYGKTLNELTLAQIAMLAGIPQAPSRENPIINPAAARERRNHVLQRMLELKHIDITEYNTAIAAPIVASYHELQPEVVAPYVEEMVKNLVVSQYGDDIYSSGIKIYTTIDSRLQNYANQALHDGILAYDQRHGYRGPEGHLSSSGGKDYWRQKLRPIGVVNDLFPAAVLRMSSKAITAMLSNGVSIDINPDNFSWANPQLSTGDIIRVYKLANGQWRLAQVPKIDGAMVVLDPKDGSIVALTGGFSHANSSFNRATLAERQPGSSFKPFIFSAALNKGFTLASIIDDSPFVFNDPYTNAEWRPNNDDGEFYGPIRLRRALELSRNLVSVRLLQSIGIRYTLDYVKKFGFSGKEAPYALSLALGTGIVTPLKMAEGYATFANGGYKVTPFFVNSITDVNNKSIFNYKIPEIVRVITPQNAYLMTDALKGVLKFGTAHKAAKLQRNDLAGKTGTTNDHVDGWFIGYNSDLVAAVWIGFDQLRSTHEHGSQSALPIWIQFMQNALANKSEHDMVRPEGIESVRIDPSTGLLASSDQDDAIFELFTTGTVPQKEASGDNADNSQGHDRNHPINMDNLDITTAPLF